MNVRDITKLTDYPLIEKLAQALWEQETFGHGVAIMVGAGFSRCAATTYDTDKKLPIWRDLAQKLADELGESEHTDALRLAQMYQDYFGKTRLYDLLKNAVEDEIWEPTKLYQDLLTLPWSEVLTTNWDTLLERASRNIHEPIYDIVSKQEDLASCHSPRIVKLHGTINVSSDLIFTQEDYRCYPQKYGIFVNFVRQVFVENELCLIGFSGDDPNFLQWIGWVRDNLQSNARRIYLVGALNLSAAKRKYLESLNVAPIDLSGIVTEYNDINLQHKTATELFLKELNKLAPEYESDWEPTELTVGFLCDDKWDIELNLQNLMLPILKKDRHSYPNWLVCPYELQMKILNNLENLDFFLKLKYKLTKVSKELCDKLLYEIFWLHQISSKPLDEDYIKLFLEIYDSTLPSKLTMKQQLEIALFLLKYSRWANENSILHKYLDKINNILYSNFLYWPELKTELAYHQSIVALDKLDYHTVEEELDEIVDSDPIWKLRKAYLLVELAEYETSANLIKQAVYELSMDYRNNHNSIYFLSRFAWAKYLERIIDKVLYNKRLEVFDQALTIKKCNPYDFMFELTEKIKDRLNEQDEDERRRKRTPAFDSGHYTYGFTFTSNSSSSKNTPHATEIWFYDLCTTVGLPYRWRDFNLLRKEAFKLSKIDKLDKFKRISIISRLVDNKKFDEINYIFSRNKIAQLNDHEVDLLFDYFYKAVKYWKRKVIINQSKKNQDDIKLRLSIYIEFLARIQIRNSIERAKKSFKLAMEFGSEEFENYEISESLSHLILYSLKSIPKNRQSELLIESLKFPVKKDKFYQSAIIYYPGTRSEDINITYLIKQLINTLEIEKISSESGKSILYRLLPLIENKFITNEERQKLIEIVYGKKYNFNCMNLSDINPRFFLALYPDNYLDKIKQFIADKLYNSFKEEGIDSDKLNAIKNLALHPTNKILPTPEQAIALFDHLVSWRYSESNDMTYFARDYFKEKRIADAIGAALRTAIIPMLPDEAINQNRFNALCKFINEVKFDASVTALIPFVLHNRDWNEEVQRIIRSGLRSENYESVEYSAVAIFDWGHALDSDKSLIRSLIQRLIYMIHLSNFLALGTIIGTINEMYNELWLTDDDINNLIECLPELFEKTDYNNFKEDNEDVIGIPLIRVQCVKLARDILKRRDESIPALENILKTAREDALPEVRFAELDQYFTNN